MKFLVPIFTVKLRMEIIYCKKQILQLSLAAYEKLAENKFTIVYFFNNHEWQVTKVFMTLLLNMMHAV